MVDHALNECGRSYPQEMGFLRCWGCYESALGRAGSGSWWLMGTGRDKLLLCSASSGRAWNCSWKPEFGSLSSFLREDEGQLEVRERVSVHSLQGRCNVFPHRHRHRHRKKTSRRLLVFQGAELHDILTNHSTWLGLMSHSGIASSSTWIWNTSRFLVNIWR